MTYRITRSHLAGTIKIPPSKSHTIRAILFATMAKGKSTIKNYLPSPDTDAMIKACQQIGAIIHQEKEELQIQGTSGFLKQPEQVIDVGNSGQVLRFISGLLGLIPSYSVITGDHSICHLRPMTPLLEALTQRGVFAVSTKSDGHAPIIIKGPASSGSMTLDGKDSQPVSAALIMSAFLEGESTITVRNPGETPWIALTLYWFEKLGIKYEHSNFTNYRVNGSSSFSGFEYTVPGDWSSAAFPLVAALITKSEITIENLDRYDIQGDKEILSILEHMGAQLQWDDKKKSVHIHSTKILKGVELNINKMIDALPIIAVLGCFAIGETHLSGGEIARQKECDRIAVIAKELKSMGAKIEEKADGLIIKPSRLHGAKVHSHNDHRIAMALSVAGMSAEGITEIEETSCVEKSYYNFVSSFQNLGAALDARDFL